MLTIQESRPADVAAVYALICEMEERRLPRPAFDAIYREVQASPAHCLLLARCGDAVAGCLHLRMEAQLHHAARVAEIMELAVGAAWRSQGVGRSLFRAACDRARQAGCVQIEVACNQLRHRAHHFYETMGMHNFHYKFSLDFSAAPDAPNRLGR